MKHHSKKYIIQRFLANFIPFVFTIFLAPVPYLLAATFYVDQNHSQASDSNPGTENLPWQTLAKAAATLVAGDTVLVKQGTYTETGGDWNTPDVNPSNSGQPGSPITFKAYPGHKVIVNGSMGSQKRNYTIVDGFDLKTIRVFGSSSQRVKGVIIQNNTIHGRVGAGCDNLDGIRVEKTSGTIVRNNRIFDHHSTPKGCDGVGVRLYHSDNAIIENNEVYDVADGLYDKADGDSNIFRYNYVHDCLRVGIRIASHNGDTIRNDRVYGNIVVRCTTGIAATGSSNSPNVDTLLYNNSVDNSDIRIDRDITNTQAWNNITYGESIPGSNPSLGYCDYNLYYLASNGCGSNSLSTDPQFVSTSFQNPTDFKLQSTSPAKGAGRNGEDIGAYPTGNEVIGLLSGPLEATPPTAPSNLTVR